MQSLSTTEEFKDYSPPSSPEKMIIEDILIGTSSEQQVFEEKTEEAETSLKKMEAEKKQGEIQSQTIPVKNKIALTKTLSDCFEHLLNPSSDPWIQSQQKMIFAWYCSIRKTSEKISKDIAKRATPLTKEQLNALQEINSLAALDSPDFETAEAKELFACIFYYDKENAKIPTILQSLHDNIKLLFDTQQPHILEQLIDACKLNEKGKLENLDAYCHLRRLLATPATEKEDKAYNISQKGNGQRIRFIQVKKDARQEEKKIIKKVKDNAPVEQEEKKEQEEIIEKTLDNVLVKNEEKEEKTEDKERNEKEKIIEVALKDKETLLIDMEFISLYVSRKTEKHETIHEKIKDYVKQNNADKFMLTSTELTKETKPTENPAWLETHFRLYDLKKSPFLDECCVAFYTATCPFSTSILNYLTLLEQRYGLLKQNAMEEGKTKEKICKIYNSIWRAQQESNRFNELATKPSRNKTEEEEYTKLEIRKTRKDRENSKIDEIEKIQIERKKRKAEALTDQEEARATQAKAREIQKIAEQKAAEKVRKDERTREANYRDGRKRLIEEALGEVLNSALENTNAVILIDSSRIDISIAKDQTPITAEEKKTKMLMQAAEYNTKYIIVTSSTFDAAERRWQKTRFDLYNFNKENEKSIPLELAFTHTETHLSTCTSKYLDILNMQSDRTETEEKLRICLRELRGAARQEAEKAEQEAEKAEQEATQKAGSTAPLSIQDEAKARLQNLSAKKTSAHTETEESEQVAEYKETDLQRIFTEQEGEERKEIEEFTYIKLPQEKAEPPEAEKYLTEEEKNVVTFKEKYREFCRKPLTPWLFFQAPFGLGRSSMGCRVFKGEDLSWNEIWNYAKGQLINRELTRNNYTASLRTIEKMGLMGKLLEDAEKDKEKALKERCLQTSTSLTMADADEESQPSRTSPSPSRRRGYLLASSP